MRFFKLTVLSTFLLSYLSFSGGFQLNDHSARSIGLGFSTVANVNDASANYFNPACLGQNPNDFSISLGASYIMPSGTFTGFTTLNEQNTSTLETWNFLIPNFYASWKSPIKGLNLGLGVFVPFGLGTRWPSDWAGRFSSVETYLQNIEINPNISFDFEIAGMPMSIAAGYGYVISDVSIQRHLSTFTPEPVLKLAGNSTGTTFNFGLNAEFVKGLKLGIAYRHNIKVDYEGDVTYENVSGLEALFQSSKGTTSLNYPNDLKVGLSYKINEKTTVEAGINYVGWSSYDSLIINFDKGPGNPASTYRSASARLYKDVIAYRIGLEHLCTDAITGRLGFTFDPMPVETSHVEPMLPEGNKLMGSIGMGYKFNNHFSCDAAYMGIYALQTETVGNPNGIDGIYNTWANVVSLSLNVNF